MTRNYFYVLTLYQVVLLTGFKYVFGPVPSRRLGRSLGVNLVPLKVCNYSCIYCQLGKTTTFTNVRREYFPGSEVFKEVLRAIEVFDGGFDYLTFIGDGEPLLNSAIDWLVSKVKEVCPKPIAVLSNGSLLYLKEVREGLMYADVVKVSLDAGSERLFRFVNRPHKDLTLSKVVEGWLEFRDVFKGELWVEVMLVRDVNDSLSNAEGIVRILRELRPAKVHVMVPTRPPTEPWVKPATSDKVIEFVRLISRCVGAATPIYLPETGEFNISKYPDPIEALLSIIKVHPMREEQVVKELVKAGLDPKEVIERLIEEGKVRKEVFEGITYLVYARKH